MSQLRNAEQLQDSQSDVMGLTMAAQLFTRLAELQRPLEEPPSCGDPNGPGSAVMLGMVWQQSTDPRFSVFQGRNQSKPSQPKPKPNATLGF